MDEIGQKKSGFPIAVLILLAVLGIGAFVLLGKKNADTTTPTDTATTEQLVPADPNAPATTDETAIITDTKKLNIDRSTSTSADIPTSYTSNDPEVVKMMAAKTLGSDTAPVKIIEYSSLTCGHCGAFHRDVLPEFKTKFIDTGKVQITYKEFPLNEPAVNASMILRCLPAKQYHSFMAKLFANQDKWAYDPAYKDLLRGYAKEAGMDDAGFETCLANDELKKSLIGDMKAAAEQYKVQSTPSFVFGNGKRVLVGNQPMAIFEETIAKAEKGEFESISENLGVSPSKTPVTPDATPTTAPAQ
jgi:protein-disulfide isomerase